MVRKIRNRAGSTPVAACLPWLLKCLGDAEREGVLTGKCSQAWQAATGGSCSDLPSRGNLPRRGPG